MSACSLSSPRMTIRCPNHYQGNLFWEFFRILLETSAALQAEKRRTEMISAAIERCAGIDVGKKFLAVCVMVGPLQGEPQDDSSEFHSAAGDPRVTGLDA